MADDRYFVFYVPRWERALSQWLATLPPVAQITLFELEPSVPQPWRDRFPCVTYEHFLSEADFDAVDQHALALAQSWYVVDGVDVTADEANISLGKLVEYDVVIPWVAALKHLAIIEAILARKGEVTFVCCDRLSLIGRALNAFSARHPLNVVWQTGQDEPPAPAQSHDRTSALTDRVRPWLRLALQSVLISLTAVRRGLIRRREAKPSVLFYSSFHQYLDYLKGIVAADCANVFVYNPVVRSWNELLSLKVNLLLDRPPLSKPGTAAAWRARWTALQAQPQFSARFETGGLPLWPLAEPILAELFEKRFAKLADLRRRVAAVLRRCRPALVVVPQDVRDTPRLLVMLAQAAGIPTLATEHGIIANYPHRVLPIAARIALWGQGDIAYYQRHGYARERFAVIGQPVLERLWAARSDTPVCGAAVADEARHPPKDRPQLILFAAQPYVPISARNSPVEIAELIQLVVAACRKRSDWQLVLKLHSSMDGSELAHVNTSGVNLRIERTGSIYALLAEADVLVTWSSTAGLEGLVMGKPLIVLQVPGKTDYVPYVTEGAALGATTPVELTEAIEQVLAHAGSGADDTATRRASAAAFIRDHVETIDDLGSAQRRFVDLTREMAGLP